MAKNKLPRVAPDAWSWGNDGTFDDGIGSEQMKPAFDSAMSRRNFMLAGTSGCALALAGCSWTPRNAGSQQASSSLQCGSQAASSNGSGESSRSVSGSESAPP